MFAASPACRLAMALVLVLSTQSLLLVQGGFLLQQDRIAERYCIKRDHPENDCNGQCFLQARLHEHDHRGHEAEGPAEEHHNHDGTLPGSRGAVHVLLSLQAVPVHLALPLRPSREVREWARPRDERVPRTACRDEVFRPPRLVG